MTDAPVTVKPKTARWIKILLGLSLALNLAVVGIVAGAAFRIGNNPQGGGPRTGFILLSAMEKDDRRAIVSDFRKIDRSTRRAGHENTKELLELLRADTFDAERAALLVTATRSASETIQEKMQARWLERVEGMTLEDRAIYADRLEEKMSRRGKGKRRH